MDSRTTKSLERWIPLCLLAVFFLVSSHVLGISADDDSYYLQDAINFHKRFFLINQYWAPLYAYWNLQLIRLCADPIARYFLSWGLLASLVSLIPLVMRVPYAWIYSFILIVIPLLTFYPYISLLATSLLVFGMCLVLRTHWRVPRILGLFCCIAFVICFLRTEFNFAVYLSSAAAVIAVAVDSLRSSDDPAPERRSRLLGDLGMLAVLLTLTAIAYYAATHSVWQRSGLAFAQHFNRRAAERGLLEGATSWKSDYSQRMFGIDLTHNASNTQVQITDFLKANPRLFFGQLFRNLTDIKMVGLLSAFFFFGLWPWVRKDARRYRPASIFLLCLSAAPLGISTVIYPRNHYLMLVIPSLTLYALQLIRPDRWLKPAPWVLAVGCVLIWLFNIGLPASHGQLVSADRLYLYRVECARAIDRIAPPGRPAAFESELILNVYFVHTRQLVNPDTLPQWDQFKTWAQTTQPAWIAANNELAARYGVTPPQLDKFLQDDLGYTPRPCPTEAKLTMYTNDKPLTP